MSSALVRTIETRLKYMSMVLDIQKIDQCSDKYVAMLLQATQDILKTFNGAKRISFDEAVAIQQLVNDSKLTADMIKDVVHALDCRVAGEIGSSEGSKQNLKFLDKYLNEEVQFIIDSTEPPEQKIYAGGRHLLKLRVSSLNEKSWSHCLSIILHRDISTMCGDTRLKYLKQLKDVVRNGTPNIALTGPEDFTLLISRSLFENTPTSQLSLSTLGTRQWRALLMRLSAMSLDHLLHAGTLIKCANNRVRLSD